MPKTARRREPVATIPLDLLASVMGAGLRDRAKIVLSVVLARSLGPEAMSRVPLRPTPLSKLTGLGVTDASAGIRDLLNAGLITGSLKDGYALNRGYLPPKERLGGRLRSYCRSRASLEWHEQKN